MDEAAERVDDRVREARDVYERQGKVFRFAWVAVTVLVVLGGLAMIVLPGFRPRSSSQSVWGCWRWCSAGRAVC